MRTRLVARTLGSGLIASIVASAATAPAAPSPGLGPLDPDFIRKAARGDFAIRLLPPDKAAARIQDLLDQGDQSAAEEHLREIVPKHLDHPRLLFLLGACVRSRFDEETAARVFARVAELAPESREGLCANLMVRMDGNQGVAPAFDALRLLVGTHPDDPVLLWMLAVQCRARSSNHEGVRYYHRLEQIWRPGPVLLHQTYANLLDEIDSHERALQERQVAVGMERARWSVDAMATTLMDLERFAESEALYREVLAHDPDSPRNRYRLGECLMRAGRFEEALAEFREADRRKPGDAVYLSRCVECLLWMDRPEEALAKCVEMRKAGIKDPWTEKQLNYLVWQLNHDSEGKPMVPEVTPRSLPADSATDAAARSKAGLALVFAATAGNREAVRSLLAWGADVAATNDHGCTALHHAAEYGHPEVVADLIKAGAPLEARNQWRQTPLYVLTHWINPRNLECARLLLEAGADPNTEAAVGSAIRFALSCRNRKLAELLHRAAGQVDGARAPNGATPLARACGRSESAIARWFIEHGADPNARDNEERTPLMHALLTPLNASPASWSPDLLALLLRAKADPNLEDKTGATALDWAAYVGHGEAVDFLIRNGAARHAPRFPRWHSAPGLSEVERFALACQAPLLCLTGGRPGIPGGLSGKQPATRQLKDFWGLANARQLKDRLSALDGRTTETGGSAASNAVPAAVDATTDPAGWVLRAAAVHYRTNGLPGRTAARPPANDGLPRLAWHGIHRLHLAALGRTAEWLPPAEAGRVVDETAARIGAAFGSWAEFAAAAELGQRLLQPRDTDRYQLIFSRLADGADLNNPWGRTPWPKRGGS